MGALRSAYKSSKLIKEEMHMNVAAYNPFIG